MTLGMDCRPTRTTLTEVAPDKILRIEERR
jgi:hypothetical protein